MYKYPQTYTFRTYALDGSECSAELTMTSITTDAQAPGRFLRFDGVVDGIGIWTNCEKEPKDPLPIVRDDRGRLKMRLSLRDCNGVEMRTRDAKTGELYDIGDVGLRQMRSKPVNGWLSFRFQPYRNRKCGLVSRNVA